MASDDACGDRQPPAGPPGWRAAPTRDGAGEMAPSSGGKTIAEYIPQPFIRLMSSTAIEPRLRKKTTRMASPIAASAAATVSTISANTWPTMSPEAEKPPG